MVITEQNKGKSLFKKKIIGEKRMDNKIEKDILQQVRVISISAVVRGRKSINKETKIFFVDISCTCCYLTLLLLIFAIIPLLLQLPSKLVVRPIVHELTAITEPTEPCLLEVLTDVRCIIPACGGTQVGWRPHWPLPVR